MSESENPAVPSPEPSPHRPRTNQDWWPDQLDLTVLHQHSPLSNPLEPDFDYSKEVESLDVEALRQDLIDLMTDSQDWWPADFGHYGGLFIRMSWHSAGTYRIADGRGGGGKGAQRFAPLNSWPDNVSLDKARRLLWPIKQKYGRKLSWADLLVFAGNCAYESMGFKTFGFAFGREDIWEPDEVFWGPEDTWLGDERYAGERELQGPLGAVQMGLIYVNPEGPNGNPEILASGRDIRETFARMAMNDVETAALIVGGHTVGKTHGAAPADNLGPEPEGAPLEQQGLGWKNSHGTGAGADTITSGLEVTWTPLRRSGTTPSSRRCTPTSGRRPRARRGVAVDAEGRCRRGHRARRPRPGEEARAGHAHQRPRAALRPDLRRDHPALARPSRGTRAGVRQGVVQAAAPRHGSALAVPRTVDPGTADLAGPGAGRRPRADRRERHRLTQGEGPRLGSDDPAARRHRVGVGASFRGTDKRGGANGARVRLEPQKDWEANEPEQLAQVLQILEGIQQDFNGSGGNKKVSLADLIVLAGNAAVEKAAKDAGHDITVPFFPGRTDASQEWTDVESFEVLEPKHDGFRNYLRGEEKLPPEKLFLERANLLTLTAPETTVLVGGLRALGANHGGSKHGVFTDRPQTLTNDFFVNLLDMGTEWKVSQNSEGVYEGRARGSDQVKYTATAVDLVFGHNSQLRALAEVYATDDAGPKFVRDFVAAWTKVMNLDRFDLKK